MPAAPDEVQSLTDSLLTDLIKALALPQMDWTRTIVRLMFGRAARRFAELGARLDRIVAESGIPAGARWVLPHFTSGFRSRGEENIPSSGPLVIASNHPGSFDSVLISAHVHRSDYKVIIGDIPFFQKLPHVSEHAIFAPVRQDTFGRMQVIRKAIRHLAGGGSLLIFARGGIEPDPDFMPDPDAEFNLWSRSLQIFLEHVPQTRVLTTIVSGVVARAAMSHPITRLRHLRPDKQRLAFMMQMAQQVLSGREKFGLVPHVSFGELIGISESGSASGALERITQSARTLLRSHLAWSRET